MWLQVKLAWRNVLRNTRRTIIAAIAIGVGLASMIFVDALTIGMEHNMIHSATASYMGHAQVHNKQFTDTREAASTINGLDTLLQQLRNDSLVKYASPRILGQGMISSPANMSAVQMIGVDPTVERYVSHIDDALVEGGYFADTAGRAVIIGSKLAERLEVELGDRVVMTMAEATSGNLSQQMLRVRGIYHFNSTELDQGMAFVRIDRARQLLALPDQAHEIALVFNKEGLGRKTKHPFYDRYSYDGNLVEGWSEILPQLEAALQMSQFSTYIVGLVLFAVVSLGIINTLFMSLHERMFEFGVMRAVGTQPIGMARLILLEAAALALISVLLGVILGWLVTSIVAQHGIDYSGIEFAGATFREPLYPVLQTDQFIRFPVMVFLFTLIVAVYPAWSAAKLNPADAMRKSM
ncbi:FtsX-like permease family protein [candidate division GN15 bacterium]|nr:FtsX-like permease family protein [candidate division GN15 bacterium]